MNPIIIIPARMASTRLPGKPLAEIVGKPMIAHVADRAREADCGTVLVAADDRAIFEAVRDHGHHAIMTAIEHPSGSDRIAEALELSDPGAAHDTIINVQGDLPTIAPQDIRAALKPLEDIACDIATLGTVIEDDAEKTNENVVKIVGAPLEDASPDILRALYFTRATAPWGEGPLYHHIGLYAYRREALKRFVALPPSALEKRERLEQLRALENAMSIHAAIIDTVPLGVDTPSDLEKARHALA
ncbi:MAG: 3-deoxy-manno-octulosonate cytidylyltransferase [Pseudomonadota bacterium]